MLRNKWLLVCVLLLSTGPAYAQIPCDTATLSRIISQYHRSQALEDKQFVRIPRLTLFLIPNGAEKTPVDGSNSLFSYIKGPVFRFYLMAVSRDCKEVTLRFYKRYSELLDGKVADAKVPDALLLEFSDATGDDRPSMGELHLGFTSDYYMTIDSGGLPACALLYVYVSYPGKSPAGSCTENPDLP